MLIFQLPQRQIRLEKNIADMPPPYHVSLKIKLGPEEFFGDAPLTGRMRQLEGGQKVQMRDPTFHGLPKPLPIEGQFATKFSYIGVLSGVPITFDGGTCTLDFIVNDLDTLGGFIQDLTERLAACFAPACIVPVEIISMTGSVNGTPFTVGLDGRWHIQVGAREAVEKQLDLCLPNIRDTPRQIVSAQRYLAQNYRMDYLTEYTAHVTGERLLNICKSFESLIPASIFAGDPMKQDVRIKSFLETWEVHDKYIDVLISLRKLRSSLDIAHTRRSPISTEGHEAIESFIPLAETCVGNLINLALEKFSLDPATYQEERNEIEDISALKYLLRYADTPAPAGDIRILPRRPADN